MSDVVHTESTRLEDEDFGWFLGQAISDIGFVEPESWSFVLSNGGVLTTHGGTWRLLKPDSMVICSQDHGHPFGRPAPVDAVAAARSALGDGPIAVVRVRGAAPDLELGFGNGWILEVLALSAGYECWQTRDPSGRCVVVSGSRHAATWRDVNRGPGP